MRNIALGLALAVLAIAPAAKSQVGRPPPPLNAARWFNSPPITYADLEGKAVWLQIFRTW